MSKADFQGDSGGGAVSAGLLGVAGPEGRHEIEDCAVKAGVKSGAARASGGVRVKSVALPTEHGGWGITLEPVLLGLLVAPSWAGAGVALATAGAFLARHPFKIVTADRRRGRRFARTPVAEAFTLAYALVALSGFLLALAVAPSYEFLLPLMLAAPLGAVQLFYDAAGHSRGLLPEVAGSTAMASVAACIALAGGASPLVAMGLWVVLAARFVPAILYVRARLVKLHGKAAARWPSLLAHASALALVSALAWVKAAPWLSVALMLVMLARAGYGFAREWPSTAKRVGFSEIAFGVLTVLTVGAGVIFGL